MHSFYSLAPKGARHFSSVLSPDNSSKFWKTKATESFLIFALASSGKSCRGFWLINISPDEGESKPANIPNKVDLPDPDGPTTANEEEALTFKLISSRITISSSLK